MKLTQNLIKTICEDINSSQKISLRAQDFKRFKMLEGNSQEIIKEAIFSEFKDKQAIMEMSSRIVPLNITEKIIKKLSHVYLEDPVRMPKMLDDVDSALIYGVESCGLNLAAKEGNRYFKLFKRNLEEIYLENGKPKVRNLPKHTYEVFNFDKSIPTKVDVVAKLLHMPQDRKEQRIVLWSDESHFIVDGSGKILADKMLAMGNEKGINPFGKIPFNYTNQASYSVNPLPDDDLLRMSTIIPILLTDLLFATKYQCWGVIYTVGMGNEKIPFQPNTVIQTDFTADGKAPEINVVKPDIDSEKVISIVESLLSYLLSSKNLSANTIIGKHVDTASGVSKILDSAELMEDKKDQQEVFRQSEKRRFEILAKYLMPYWKKTGQLEGDFAKLEFSKDFELSIHFKEPKVLMSDKEKIELSSLKIDKGFSTFERELKEIYPHFSEDQIQELVDEIQSQVSNQSGNSDSEND